jgi:putative ABC transport system substrate-binding protein
MTIAVARRRFLAVLGSAAVAAPRVVRAQKTERLPTVGFLGASTAAAWAPFTAAFVRRLNELGWSEGRNLAIAYRWADGHADRFAEIAAEFVRLKVDVIFAPVTVVAIAAKQATSTIPIVFALVGDPPAIGLAASLARPGGNITGASNQSGDLAGKRLDLMREVVPALRRLAILVNAASPSAVLESEGVAAAARTAGVEFTSLGIRHPADIGPAFDKLAGQADALYVGPDPLMLTNFTRINTLVLGAKLVTMYGSRDFVVPGGLMSYGANFEDQFRRAAGYVDKILRGATPGDLPIEQPTKFDLVINLTTAKALGVRIPEALLLRTDEILE